MFNMRPYLDLAKATSNASSLPNEQAFLPRTMPVAVGGLRPPIIAMRIGSSRVYFVNTASIRLAVFAQRSRVADILAHYAAGSSIALGRIMHVRFTVKNFGKLPHFTELPII